MNMFVLESSVTVSGLEEFGISAVIVLICLLGLIAILVLKFLNVVRICGFYANEHIYTTLFLASIFMALVFVSLMIHPVLSFAIYLYICVFLYSLTWIFFIVEMIILPAKIVTEHKETRFTRPR